jgi:tetratricopeptide (TPR) repeat protein
MKLGWFTVLILASQLAHAQDSELEKLREEQKIRAIRSHLDSAILLTDAGEFEKADAEYQYVLKNLKSIPSELAYHFGRNSYLVGKYAQSIDWLNKYIQLKGVSGTHYDDAVLWLEKANAARLKEREQETAKATIILSRNYDIDCGPTGKVTCPVCNGSTVVIRRTYLGDSYKACTTCTQKGYLNCTDFNKLLRGELKSNP